MESSKTTIFFTPETLIDRHTMRIPGRVRPADSLDPAWFREASMRIMEAEKRGEVVPEGMALPGLAEEETGKFESICKAQIVEFLRTGSSDAIHPFTKFLARSYPRFLEESAYTNRELAMEIHRLAPSLYVCRYHIPSWDPSTISEAPLSPNQMSCGCNTTEVLLDFFLRKLHRVWSDDPVLTRLQLEAMRMKGSLNPAARRAVCEAFMEETLLTLNDIYLVEFGVHPYTRKLTALQVLRVMKVLEKKVPLQGAPQTNSSARNPGSSSHPYQGRLGPPQAIQRSVSGGPQTLDSSGPGQNRGQAQPRRSSEGVIVPGTFTRTAAPPMETAIPHVNQVGQTPGSQTFRWRYVLAPGATPASLFEKSDPEGLSASFVSYAQMSHSTSNQAQKNGYTGQESVSNPRLGEPSTELVIMQRPQGMASDSPNTHKPYTLRPARWDEAE